MTRTFEELVPKGLVETLAVARSMAEQIDAAMSSQARVIRTLGEAVTRTLNEAFKGLDTSFLECFGALVADMAPTIEAARRAEYEFALILVPLGWPPPLDIYPTQAFEIITACETHGLEAVRKEIGRFLVRFYDANVLKKKLDSWRRRPWLKKRIPILEAVVSAHLSRQYALSVPAMMAQIDGIISQSYGWQGWKKAPSRALKDDINRLFSEAKTFDEAFRRFVTEVVLDGFEYGAPVRSSLSRHAILHGVDLKYGTAENSLKAILTFDYLQDSIMFVGRARGQTYHVVGCPKANRGKSQRVVYRSASDAKGAGMRPCAHCLRRK